MTYFFKNKLYHAFQMVVSSKNFRDIRSINDIGKYRYNISSDLEKHFKWSSLKMILNMIVSSKGHGSLMF